MNMCKGTEFRLTPEFLSRKDRSKYYYVIVLEYEKSENLGSKKKIQFLEILGLSKLCLVSWRNNEIINRQKKQFYEMKILHLGHYSHLMSKLKSILYDCSGPFKRFMFLTRVKLFTLKKHLYRGFEP